MLPTGWRIHCCSGTSGDVFTSLHSYYNGEPSIFSLIAVVDSEVWTVSYYRMKMLSDKYPELVVWMRNLLIEQLYGFEKRYVFFNNKTAEDRFLNFLRISTARSVALRSSTYPRG